MTDKFVLAECTEESPEPFTVWRLDQDGNGVHSGKYYLNKQDAEWEFCSLAFDWFQDNVAINFIDEKEPASEVEAPEQALDKMGLGYKKYGIPQKVFLDNGSTFCQTK